MSDPTFETPHEQPAESPQHPPSQPVTMPSPPAPDQVAGPVTPTKRSNIGAWAVGAVVLVLALVIGGVAINAVGGDDAESSAAASSTTAATPTTAAPTTAAPTTAAPTTEPAWTPPAYATPTRNDFKLKVKVLRKQCFGSAGCNITYRIDVTHTGEELDPSKTYEVTYEVKGGEDPAVNTFEVTGSTASVQQEETGSTRRSTDKLTAVVTDVSEL